ncbi:secreted protein [Melampsora americana]|nr:secreted protein [Melampsora americana]
MTPRLVALVTFLYVLSLNPGIHGIAVPNVQFEGPEVWNKGVEMKSGRRSSLFKRSLLKTCWQGRKITDMKEETTKPTPFLTLTPFIHKSYLDFSKPSSDLHLFKTLEKTDSAPLIQIKPKGRTPSVGNKVLSHLACEADTTKFSLNDFDTSSDLSRGSHSSSPSKDVEEVRPTHEDRPLTIDEKLSNKFDAADMEFALLEGRNKFDGADRESTLLDGLISPTPSDSSYSSRSTTSEEDSDDEPFSFYPDSGESLRERAMESPDRFPRRADIHEYMIGKWQTEW